MHAAVRQAPAAPPRDVVAGAVPAVQRAVSLLDLLARTGRPHSLAELTHTLGLPKSSVHGLCHTLSANGYLRRVEGGFFIGPAVMSLAHAFSRHTSLSNEFAALWQELPQPPEDTVIVSVLIGNEVLYVATRNGNRPLGLAFNEGMRLPAHLAASGKAMLAWRSESALRALFPTDPLPRLTGHGVDSVRALMDELARTRERGYSVDDEGVREGVVCFGAPVFGADGEPVAGLGMCLHKSRLDETTARSHQLAVTSIAGQLTQRMGGRAPDMATGEAGHE
jgi:DNA-binding IclR family transcriptional regulator